MKIASVVGARPQFIKISPLIRAIEEYNRLDSREKIEHLIIHTGQHYDYLMDRVFFEELGLPEPNYNLGVGSGSHNYQTAEILKRLEEVLLREKPDLVLVYGDTNSTLGGALAASKIRIPVGHVEAGLRSFNKNMAEEINRVITDHISDYLFCPTETAVKNLKREGIEKGVYLVGDVMYDAVLYSVEIAEKKRDDVLERISLKPKEYVLATIHRAENTDDTKRLFSIFSAFKMIASKGLKVVVPLHPRTKKSLHSLFQALEPLPSSLAIIDPLSYFEMLLIEKNARTILTDSGGVQKEAYWFRVPCVTLREETEWIETVESGWNRLAGCDPVQITELALDSWRGNEDFCSYGDGKASKRIVAILRQKL